MTNTQDASKPVTKPRKNRVMLVLELPAGFVYALLSCGHPARSGGRPLLQSDGGCR